MTGSASDIMNYKSKLSFLPFSLPEHLLSQLAAPYASISQEAKMILGEVAKLTKKSSVSPNKRTLLISTWTKYARNWAYTSIASYVSLRKRTIDCRSLLAQLWTARWKLRLVVMRQLRLALTIDDHWLATTLFTSDNFPYQKLSSLYSTVTFLCDGRSAHVYHCIRFSDPISRRKCDPLAVTLSLILRYLVKETILSSFLYSGEFLILSFA